MSPTVASEEIELETHRREALVAGLVDLVRDNGVNERGGGELAVGGARPLARGRARHRHSHPHSHAHTHAHRWRHAHWRPAVRGAPVHI